MLADFPLQPLQSPAMAPLQYILKSRQNTERAAQCHQIPSIGTAYLHTAHNALQISHGLQLLCHRIPQSGVTSQLTYGLLALLNAGNIEQRTFNPTAQAASTYAGFSKI